MIVEQLLVLGFGKAIACTTIMVNLRPRMSLLIIAAMMVCGEMRRRLNQQKGISS
ncbi:hypothetical protein [Nostoc sp. DSM 114160]